MTLIVTTTSTPFSLSEGQHLLVALPPWAAYDCGPPQLAAPAAVQPTPWRSTTSDSSLLSVGTLEVPPASWPGTAGAKRVWALAFLTVRCWPKA